MKKTRIAVISDLHIGTKAVALDLCPHDLPAEKRVGLPNDFLENFLRHVQSSAFKAAGEIDMLCVTGDISNQADPKEFRLADRVIGEIANSLNIKPDRIYFVPGNHDVHWPVMKLSPSDFWGKYRYAPLLQTKLIFELRSTQATEGRFNESPHFVAWRDRQRLIIGINTAAYDSPQPDEGEHFGLVQPETLTELDAYLAHIKIEDDDLRICLIHHHPVLYSDARPGLPDFSALTNAENLLATLSKHRFDLLIHGHKHVPHLLHKQFVSNGHPLTVLGAGSFSAQLETQWVGRAQNQFHVIEVDGRDATSKAVQGYVETWEYSADGSWIASHSRAGLCATENFGNMMSVTELTLVIDQHVGTILRSASRCTWQDLLPYAPRLAHANTRVAYEAFIEVGRTRGLDHFGEVDSAERKWALWQP